MACTRQSAVEYIKNNRTRLVGGLQNLQFILDHLHERKMLSQETASDINAAKTDYDKTRAILNYVTKKGEKVCYEFLKFIYQTRERTLKKPESENAASTSTQKSRDDLHYWISCFSFNDDVEMDNSYFKGIVCEGILWQIQIYGNLLFVFYF